MRDKPIAQHALMLRLSPMVRIVQISKPAPTSATASFVVNGETETVAFPASATLLEVLREQLGLTGTKHGCELGECGTCTTIVNGVPVLSCLVLAADSSGAHVETVEGLAHGALLHPLQQAFVELGAAQCGYCTPGFLIAAAALLRREPSPSREQIASELSGNLCRCTGYLKIFEAVELAAERMRGAMCTDSRDGNASGAA